MSQSKSLLPEIDVVFSAGRYNRSLDSLRDAVRSYLKRNGVNLHLGTEADAEKREQALREVARELDWGVLTGDRSYRDDCYAMWPLAEWEVLYKATRLIATGTIFNFRGNKMPKNAVATVVLKHRKSGHVLVVVCGHMPAGVEKGGRIAKRIRRGIAWMIEVRAQRRVANRLARRFKADGRVIGADWNADAKRRAVRTTLKSIMPNWKNAVRRPFEKAGTHYNRWIDFLMFRGRLRLKRSAWLMSDDDSSEHRPTRTRLQFTKRPRNRS